MHGRNRPRLLRLLWLAADMSTAYRRHHTDAISRRDGPILIITINRPKALNAHALAGPSYGAERAIDDAGADDEVVDRP